MDETVESMIKNGDLLLQKEKVMDAIREYTKAFETIGSNEDEDTADLSYRLSQAYNSLESKNDENSKKYAEISLRIHQKMGDKDFSVSGEELFSESLERPLVDRLLEAVSASGKMTKKEAINRAREVLKSLRYISFETALLSVMSDESIEIQGFLQELSGRFRK